MEHIQVWGYSVDWLNFWLTVAFFVVPPLSIAILVLLFGAGAKATYKLWLRAGRTFVDDPGDAWNEFLEKTTGVPATFWQNLQMGMIDATLKLLEGSEEALPIEVNVEDITP